jgi:two-component system cell cycle sensor histidine kinase/response regulator CckA
MQTPVHHIHNIFINILHHIRNLFSLSDLQPEDGLPYWRELILHVMLTAGIFLSLLAYIPAFIIAVREQLWGLAIFDSFVYLFLLIIRGSSRRKYEYRVWATLVLSYTVGIFIILKMGWLSGGPYWLFCSAILAGVLLGLKAAALALFLNAGIILIIGWLISQGILGSGHLFFSSMERGIAAGASFLFLNTVAALSVAVLVKGLEKTARIKDQAIALVQKEKGHLFNARKYLRHEIEEKKVTEKALLRSEMKYRNILESIDEGYYEVDLMGNFTFTNRAVSEIFGYTSSELLGMNHKGYTSRPTANRLHDIFRGVFETKHPSKILDYDVTRKDGDLRILEMSTSLIENESGEPAGFRGIARDVTERRLAQQERKKLEKELQQAEKMKAIGTLAGGVAHDLNNILSGIVSYPELLLLDLPEASPLREPITTIQESGKKAAAIVQDLLTLARRGVSVSEIVNLNDVIDEYLVSPEFGKLKSFHPSVETKTRLDSSLLNMTGSPVHISKTIMNLVSNAAEAMSDGGTIFIGTKRQYIDTPVTGYDKVEEGDYCVIEVSDTGVGINPDEISKIFEPFYTKKVMGRSGTGLGMAVVWGAVKDHKGYIQVDSVEGQGTVFKLYFPATRKQKPGADRSCAIEEYKGNGETILVVDDVKEQRTIASAILTQLGYSVKTVSSGEEAIEYMDSNKADLIILDMIMSPGVDGLDTYQQIISKNPEQKAIIASGFSETDRVKKAQHFGVGEYLPKPYTIEKIGQAVKSELKNS